MFPEEYSKYLSETPNRDKLMSMAQFVPMFLALPAAKVTGNRSIAESLIRLSFLADGYRSVTRFSGLVELLTPKKISGLLSIPHPLVKNLAICEFLCSLGFFPTEHIAVFCKSGVLPGGTPRFIKWANFCIFFWFYQLLFKCLRLSVMWWAKRASANGGSGDDATTKYARQQLKQLQLQLVGAVSYLIFSMTCISAPAQPFPYKVMAPVNAVFAALSPPHLELPLYVRGLLGIVSSSVAFL